MKNLAKFALVFVLGIAAAMAVLIPNWEAAPAPGESAPAMAVQAEVPEAVALAALIADAPEVLPVPADAPEDAPEPIAEPEPAELDEPEEPAQEDAVPEPTPAPVVVTPAPTAPVKAAEPEYFYEDGKRYTYVNGFKSYVPDGGDAVQVDFYDWENDPAGQIQGPFN